MLYSELSAIELYHTCTVIFIVSLFTQSLVTSV